MDYTLSNSYDTDAGTGHRMHEDAKAIPTVWSGSDANSIIWSLMEIIAATGLAGIQFSKASPTSYRVLLKALRSNGLISGVDTGAANVAVVDFAPPIDALADNMVLWFKAKAANSGAMTLNVNGLGAKPVVGGSHAALQGGEVIANGKCMVVWNATLNSFVLIECTGAAVQVGAASQSSHAATFGQLGLRGAVSLANLGAGNWTVPAGVFSILVKIWGGGGGGGGAGSGGGTAGGGGGAGSAWKRLAVTPGQVLPYFVGSGGPGGGAGGGGTPGTATTFNGTMTANPGLGGSVNPSGNGGSGGTATGGDVNMAGAPGGTGSASNVQGGSGGGSPGGGGGGGGAQGVAGGGGYPGGGGGGGGSGATGGAGAAGLIVVLY